jgi:3-methylcrotonyl-CoA carboxylase alpha subunit
VPHISIEAGDADLQVEVLPGGQLRVGDIVFEVQDLGDGAWRVVTNGKAMHAWTAGAREHPWVFVDGVVYRPRLGGAAGTRQARDDSASLAAPMPATVRAVLVTPGQRVARGDTVVILEAMKMELPIRASHDGVVKTVACQPGELVQPGAPLVEIE